MFHVKSRKRSLTAFTASLQIPKLSFGNVILYDFVYFINPYCTTSLDLSQYLGHKKVKYFSIRYPFIDGPVPKETSQEEDLS